MPFEGVTQRFLQAVGLKVTQSGAESADATLIIKAIGTALGTRYDDGKVHYTGAELKGSISLRGLDKSIYENTFRYRDSPMMATHVSTGCCLTPDKASFEQPFWGYEYSNKPWRSLENTSFASILLAMVNQLWGTEKFEFLLLDRLQNDNDSDARKFMASRLGETKNTRAVESLITATIDEDAGVRADAVWALGEIKDPRAVNSLITALKDGDRDVRIVAARSLGKIKDPRAVGPLILALKDAYRFGGHDMAEALGEIGDKQAVEPLIDKLTDGIDAGGTSLVMTKTIEALGKIGDTRAVAPLTKLLSKKSLNPKTRREIQDALVKIQD